MKNNYEPVIGLEIHTQAKTKSKMFCGCPTAVFGKDPNTATCPVCLGLPGALPVPNAAAIEKTVALAKALGSTIAELSQFERKNYFYPDLPKGFQISQYAQPIGVGGTLGGHQLTRVHLEEDTGRLLHEDSATRVDFNRSGIPLIEIVTEPEFSNPKVVTKFLKDLRTLLVHLEISDADMEKGSLRLEANISLRKVGEKGLPPSNSKNFKRQDLPNYKVEIKNINSFVFLEKALEAEIERQRKVLEAGEKVEQETRGFDEKRGITVSQRKKEEAFDYRYFPEPDLSPLTQKTLVSRGGLKTPEEKRGEYRARGIPERYIEVFVNDRQLAALFEEIGNQIPAPEAANILVNKRFGDPKKVGASALVAAFRARQEQALLTGGDLQAAAEKVVLDNPAAVRDYSTGKEAALQFLLGQLMKETGGKSAPEEGREVLKKTIHARIESPAKS